MKKNIILMAFLAISGMIAAQTVRYIYIPNPGERQIGFNIGPAFGTQSLSYHLKGENSEINLTNSTALNIGLSYNVETQHNRTLDWGQYTTVNYSLTPFSGILDGNREFRMKFHCFEFHVASALIYRFNEHFLASLGVGLGLGYSNPGTPYIDGNGIDTQEEDDFFSILTRINCGIDANLGGKYLITERFFVGANLHWTFLQFMPMDGFLDNSDVVGNYLAVLQHDVSNNIISIVNFNQKKPFLFECSIGYIW